MAIQRRDTGVAPLSSPARKRWWTHACEKAGQPITINVYYRCPYCGHVKTSWIESQRPSALARKKLYGDLQDPLFCEKIHDALMHAVLRKKANEQRDHSDGDADTA
jgi:hypothetical protein